MFDPYETLNVKRDADPKEIRSAYRALVKTHHPDVGGKREEWERLTLAHDVLTDPDRRAHYDATGQTGEIREEADRHQAYAMIADKIAAFADAFVSSNFAAFRDPRATKVLELVWRQIIKERDDARDAVDVGRKSLAFMQDYAGRITRRADAPGIDHVAAILREKIQGIEARILAVEEVVRVREVALKLLDDYSFEMVPGGFPNALHEFSFSLTTTT